MQRAPGREQLGTATRRRKMIRKATAGHREQERSKTAVVSQPVACLHAGQERGLHELVDRARRLVAKEPDHRIEVALEQLLACRRVTRPPSVQQLEVGRIGQGSRRANSITTGGPTQDGRARVRPRVTAKTDVTPNGDGLKRAFGERPHARGSAAQALHTRIRANLFPGTRRRRQFRIERRIGAGRDGSGVRGAR